MSLKQSSKRGGGKRTDQRPLGKINAQSITSVALKVRDDGGRDGLEDEGRQGSLGVDNVQDLFRKEVLELLHDGHVIEDSKSPKGFAQSGGLGGVEFDSQVRHVCDALAGLQGGDAGKVLQDGRIADGLAVLDIQTGQQGLCLLEVDKGEDDGAVRVVAMVDVEVVEGLVQFIGVLARNSSLAAVHVTLLKRVEVEASDDAKVIAATAQSPEQVRIRAVVDVADRSIGQDDLVVVDIVASPAVAAGEEGNASSESQSTNANVTGSAADDAELMGIKVLVHGGPQATGTNRRLLTVLGDDDLIEVSQVKHNAVAVNIGSTAKRRMASRLDGKGAVVGAQERQGNRHITSRLWSNTACGMLG